MNERPADFHHIQHSDDIHEACVFEQRDELPHNRGDDIANCLRQFYQECGLPSWETQCARRLHLPPRKRLQSTSDVLSHVR